MERTPDPPFHVERLLEDCSRGSIPITLDAAERLARFGILLRDRAIPLGLVAESDAERLYERHVLDCLRAAAVVPHPGIRVFDAGSGAGLPGIVLATAQPGNAFLLVEPKKRAAGFLDLAVDHLELRNARVEVGRVQEANEETDVATARAFGPIDRSWAALFHVLRPGGSLLYFAGARFSPADARAVSVPERPAGVVTATVIENFPPIVMMVRAE